jgi:tetratricopeptide (TPR) repeat protein
LQKKLHPTTRKTAPAATQPNSPDEQQYVDLAIQTRNDFRKALELGQAQLDSPRVGPEARRVLPLAALQAGNMDWSLASFAHDHGDKKSESRWKIDAAQDYSLAVKLNPTSVEARFQLALAFENLGFLDDAREQLIVILRDLDHYNAPAYNEIGHVILASNPTDMSQWEAAVQSFKDALKLDPNLPGVRENLAMALKMLASTRPSTRSATRPSAGPAAGSS